MAQVAVLFKVYPDNGVEGSVEKEIKSKMNPSAMQLEDVAFGIKIIKVLFVHEDNEGSSVFEDKLRKIQGVREVEVAEESLM